MSGLSFVSQGQGPWLLLLHAFPFDGRMWEPVVAELAQSHRLLIPDLRGFGRSRGLGPVKSIHQMADDVAELMRAQGITGAAVLGLSMGGYVAMALRRQHPELVEKLLLCDTRPDADDAEARAGRAKQLAVLHGAGVGALVDSLLPRLVSAQAGEAVRERLRHIGIDQAVASLSGAVVAMRDRPDASDVLRSCTVPVLGLAGAQDAVSPPEVVRAMAELAPRGGYVEIDDVGHLSC
ncbi:MAG: alpha/beta fold hydrolase, partial [Myxococcales bacterium]